MTNRERVSVEERKDIYTKRWEAESRDNLVTS